MQIRNDIHIVADAPMYAVCTDRDTIAFAKRPYLSLLAAAPLMADALTEMLMGAALTPYEKAIVVNALEKAGVQNAAITRAKGE